jgi:starch phosphorylase
MLFDRSWYNRAGVERVLEFCTKQQYEKFLRSYDTNAELRHVVDSLVSGEFSEGDRELFQPIVSSLLEHDEYLLLAGFQSYIDCCEGAAQAYADHERWTTMSILNSARSGFFSSDPSMRQYCEDIWGVKPFPVS